MTARRRRRPTRKAVEGLPTNRMTRFDSGGTAGHRLMDRSHESGSRPARQALSPGSMPQRLSEHRAVVDGLREQPMAVLARVRVMGIEPGSPVVFVDEGGQRIDTGELLLVAEPAHECMNGCQRIVYEIIVAWDRHDEQRRFDRCWDALNLQELLLVQPEVLRLHVDLVPLLRCTLLEAQGNLENVPAYDRETVEVGVREQCKMDPVQQPLDRGQRRRVQNHLVSFGVVEEVPEDDEVGVKDETGPERGQLLRRTEAVVRGVDHLVDDVGGCVPVEDRLEDPGPGCRFVLDTVAEGEGVTQDENPDDSGRFVDRELPVAQAERVEGDPRQLRPVCRSTELRGLPPGDDSRRDLQQGE